MFIYFLFAHPDNFQSKYFDIKRKSLLYLSIMQKSAESLSLKKVQQIIVNFRNMKHKKVCSTLSFKYLTNKKSIQNEREKLPSTLTNLSQKIQLLRLPIYSKKPKSRKNNSVKLIFPRKENIRDSIKLSSKNQIEKSQSQHYRYRKLNQTQLQQKVIQKRANTHTAIGHKKKFYDSSISRQQKECSSEKEKKKAKKDLMQHNNFFNFKEPEQKLKQLSYKDKDSQSLLRKNSLYLSNLVKLRQRQSIESPHIGNIPHTASHMKIRQLPKKKASKNDKKIRKNQESQIERILNSMPIDPW